MSPIDLSKISKDYAGLWVAFDERQIKAIATGVTIMEVLDRLKKKKIKRIESLVITKIPSNSFSHIL